MAKVYSRQATRWNLPTWRLTSRLHRDKVTPWWQIPDGSCLYVPRLGRSHVLMDRKSPRRGQGFLVRNHSPIWTVPCYQEQQWMSLHRRITWTIVDLLKTGWNLHMAYRSQSSEFRESRVHKLHPKDHSSQILSRYSSTLSYYAAPGPAMALMYVGAIWILPLKISLEVPLP